ncbi:MAG TPA: hypothetical protein VK701_06825 [Solirubrobacteraceae bacterium]|jgi:hypothetical protein|nr:hypothetical protein [Solirubrobacteraceae bacterium]
MFGHGWPLDPCGDVCVFGVCDGVVVVLDGVVVVVEGVLAALPVDWVVLVVELGAAAAPAMPATAPPVARAPTTRPTRMMPLLFIREPPVVGAGYANHPETHP